MPLPGTFPTAIIAAMGSRVAAVPLFAVGSRMLTFALLPLRSLQRCKVPFQMVKASNRLGYQ
jgi:hypothetical protein